MDIIVEENSTVNDNNSELRATITQSDSAAQQLGYAMHLQTQGSITESRKTSQNGDVPPNDVQNTSLPDFGMRDSGEHKGFANMLSSNDQIL